MATYLVTGANRGIGLALCKALKDQGDQVIATCRNSALALDSLGVRVETGVDMANQQSIDALAGKLEGVTIDVAICNAGIWGHQTLEDMNFEEMQYVINVNAIGPLRIVSTLQNHFVKGSKIALITSRMGSIEDNTSGARYDYRMSKAALNAAGKSLAIDLTSRDISVVMIHPGYVKTDMSPNGAVSAADAAAGILSRIGELNSGNSGRFLHQNGEELPW